MLNLLSILLQLCCLISTLLTLMNEKINVNCENGRIMINGFNGGYRVFICIMTCGVIIKIKIIIINILKTLLQTSSSFWSLKHRHAARRLNPSLSYVLIELGFSFTMSPIIPNWWNHTTITFVYISSAPVNIPTQNKSYVLQLTTCNETFPRYRIVYIRFQVDVCVKGPYKNT